MERGRTYEIRTIVSEIAVEGGQASCLVRTLSGLQNFGFLINSDNFPGFGIDKSLGIRATWKADVAIPRLI